MSLVDDQEVVDAGLPRLTVKGDHEVEYEGETYTLAQFTAKFMPRNKRSVSGVCQGPKYFTKGGTSLYLMRESFLGGKK